jgi:hypothetical protein
MLNEAVAADFKALRHNVSVGLMKKINDRPSPRRDLNPRP